VDITGHYGKNFGRDKFNNKLIMITRVQSNLAKVGIADLSPLADMNGFVQSLPPSNTFLKAT